MIICEEPKLIYVAPMKTGSSSIRDLLLKEPFNGREFGEARYRQHYTGWESWMEPYRVFVSIRHPFTMYVSLWKFICRQVDLHRAGKLNQAATAWWFKAFNEENPTFPEFICHGRMRREMRQFLSYQHHIRKIKKPIDHFVRQERLQEDIRLIPGLESVDVPRNNVSPKDSIPWHAYYDEELVNRLLRQSPGNYRALGYTRSFKNAKEGRFFTEEE